MRVIYCTLLLMIMLTVFMAVAPGPPQVLVLEIHLLNKEQLLFTEHEPRAGNWVVCFSSGCCNKTGAHKDRHVPSHRAGQQESVVKVWALPEGSRGGVFLSLPASGGPGHSSACDHIPPVSASVLTLSLFYICVTNLPLSFSYKEPVAGVIAHPDIPESS